MTDKDQEFPCIESFEIGAFDVDRFTHEAHVYVAWSYLQKTSLTDAIVRFSGALKRMTAKLGIPGKYHETSYFYIPWPRTLCSNRKKSLVWDYYIVQGAGYGIQESWFNRSEGLNRRHWL
jgi:hypothetical protein